MKTWGEIRGVDDIVLDPDKILINQLESDAKIKCPYLKKMGNFFFYCGVRAPDGTELKFEPFNKVYLAHQRPAELQMFCMDENYGNCKYFPKPSS